MVRLDGRLETVLALAGLGLAANIALAVVVWLYAAVFIGGSALGAAIALVFVAFGSAIVLGFVRLYRPGAAATNTQ